MIHICLSPNWRISKILTAFMTKQQKFRLECRYCGWAAADILVPPIDEIAKKSSTTTSTPMSRDSECST